MSAQAQAQALLRWLPAIGWMIVIFGLSSISGLRVTEDAAVDRPLRVVAHLGTFALLGGLLLFAIAGLRRPRRSQVVLAYGLTLAYAISDEIHQAFVPNRTGRLDDIVVDALGAAVGVALAWLALTWLASRRASAPRP